VKVLCVGDVMGKPGRLALRQLLPGVIHGHSIDLTIVNCENACGGMGITPDVAEEMFSWEVGVLTSGNHIWHKREVFSYLDEEPRILRPENFPPGAGHGSTVVELPSGALVGVVNLQGRVFMPQMVDDPFRTADRVVDGMRERGIRVIVVDMHAETTSEKIALARYLDGRVSAVVGTHTHVQTSDEQVLPGGTARICDLGMTGPHDSVIGMKTDLVLERFLTQRPVSFEVARRDVRLEGAVVEIDESTGKARRIERVRERLKEG
jgi:metallophosphoesterase (TIGR00282 family)